MRPVPIISRRYRFKQFNLIFEGGSVERSRAKYAGHHMKSDMAFLAQMEREIIERDAAVQGNSASIVTESRIKGRYKERDIDLVSTETAVLERDADAWKIVHLHWSSRAPESHQSLYERSPDANLAILPASVYGHRRCFAAGL